MNKKTQHIAFAARALGTLAFLAVIGSANADLKMNVTVKGTGAGTLGVPVAGQYVVDFRNGIARIEEPGGMVALFDFNASTVAYLNPTAKTYSIQPIEGMLKPRLGPTLSASITTDLSTPSQTMYGANALKYSIATQSSGGGPTASMASFGGSAPTAGNGVVSARRQRGGASQLSNTGTGASAVGLSGAAWIVDGAVIKSNVSSAAPLILLGAPRSLVQSITNTLNQKGAIPLTLSFSWTTSGLGVSTVDMSVDTVSAAALDESLFDLPANFTRVTKQTS